MTLPSIIIRRTSCMIYSVLICNMRAESFSHYDDDYISIDDLPVQDARLVRADGGDRKAQDVITTGSPFARRQDNNATDWSWLDEALRDIAYYLRSHKFNEFDRRYESNATIAAKTNYIHFPRPPLRSLHWEIKKYCEATFVNCVEYIWKKTKQADLKRSDDTSIIIQEQHWTAAEHRLQIDAVESECHKLKARDDRLGNPFAGPLERFQWRTTASYYMCWFTMNSVVDLRHLSGKCDNFANCLDPVTGSHNHDFRAEDEAPFSCALYSFCPDPCCERRRLDDPNVCWESQENPCYATNSQGKRRCELKRDENTQFEELILNHFNVTCQCREHGFVYDSMYGICVDIDECYTQNHTCNLKHGEACLNTPGSYKCVCKWGHQWDYQNNRCRKSKAVELIKLTTLIEAKKVMAPTEKSLLRRWIKKLFRSSSYYISPNIISVFATLLFISQV